MDHILPLTTLLILLALIGLLYVLWRLHTAVEALHDAVDALIVQEVIPALPLPLSEPPDASLSESDATIVEGTDIGSFRGATKWQ